MSSVLVITQDSSTLALAERALDGEGHEVIGAESAAAAIRATFNVRVDAVVVDGAIGDDEVRELCGWLRDSGSNDRVVYLASASARWLPGSLPIDEHRHEIVVKPCDGAEIRDALERMLDAAGQTRPETIQFANLTLDGDSHELQGDGRSIQLTPTEFRLMSYLAQRRGSIVSTEELLEKVWEFFPGTGSSELVRSHVRNLRSKLRLATGGAEVVQTVPRRGYRLV